MKRNPTLSVAFRGPATSVPSDLDSLESQHTTLKVGGDTLRDNSAKNNLLIESWLLRISLLCQNGVVPFKFTK